VVEDVEEAGLELQSHALGHMDRFGKRHIPVLIARPIDMAFPNGGVAEDESLRLREAGRLEPFAGGMRIDWRRAVVIGALPPILRQQVLSARAHQQRRAGAEVGYAAD